MSTVALGLSGIQKMNSTGENMPLVCARFYSALSTTSSGGETQVSMTTTDYDDYSLAIKDTVSVYGVNIPTTGYYDLSAQLSGLPTVADSVFYFKINVRRNASDLSPNIPVATQFYATAGQVFTASVSSLLYLKRGTQIVMTISRAAGTGSFAFGGAVGTDAFSFIQLKQLTQDQVARVPLSAL